jgi:hypothetical protein
MTSSRPQHIEASSIIPPGSDIEKPRAMRSLSADQSTLAAMKKTALEANKKPQNISCWIGTQFAPWLSQGESPCQAMQFQMNLLK